MSFFERSYKFLVGLYLFLRYSRRLDLAPIISGKRVAMVGPADSAHNTGLGEYIDGFDFVVRLNKAPMIIQEGKWRDDIGSKVNILFHSFFENETFGGGPLKFELYDRVGIQYVINPLPTFFGYRNTFNFYKKYLLRRSVYSLSAKTHNKLKVNFKGFRPTTGFCALYAILECDFSELYITWFTFFKTSYADGYRKTLQEVDTLRKTMDEMKIHDPEVEFQEFLKLLSKTKGKKVMMDPVLTEIVVNELKNKRD